MNSNLRHNLEHYLPKFVAQADRFRNDFDLLIKELRREYRQGQDPYEYLLILYPLKETFPDISKNDEDRGPPERGVYDRNIRKLCILLGYNYRYYRSQNRQRLVNQIYSDPRITQYSIQVQQVLYSNLLNITHSQEVEREELTRQFYKLLSEYTTEIDKNNIKTYHNFLQLLPKWNHKFDLIKRDLSQMIQFYYMFVNTEATAMTGAIAMTEATAMKEMISDPRSRANLKKIGQKTANKIGAEIIEDNTVSYLKIQRLLFDEELTLEGQLNFHSFVCQFVCGNNLRCFAKNIYFFPQILIATTEWKKIEFSYKFIPSVIHIFDSYLIPDLKNIIFTYV